MPARKTRYQLTDLSDPIGDQAPLEIFECDVHAKRPDNIRFILPNNDADSATHTRYAPLSI